MTIISKCTSAIARNRSQWAIFLAMALIFLSPMRCDARSDKSIIKCSVEQLMYFGEHPSDFPNGPAVLGNKSHPIRNPELVDPEVRMEAEVENDAIDATKQLSGAYFFIDLTNGHIWAVVPGQRLFDGLDVKPSPDETVRLFPEKVQVWKTSFLAFAFIERKTGRMKSFLHLGPVVNGFRQFEWLDLGEMLFGYC